MPTPLEAARAAREEQRRWEASLVRFTCPVCGHWVETVATADVRCQVDNRVCQRERTPVQPANM